MHFFQDKILDLRDKLEISSLFDGKNLQDLKIIVQLHWLPDISSSCKIQYTYFMVQRIYSLQRSRATLMEPFLFSFYFLISKYYSAILCKWVPFPYSCFSCFHTCTAAINFSKPFPEGLDARTQMAATFAPDLVTFRFPVSFIDWKSLEKMPSVSFVNTTDNPERIHKKRVRVSSSFPMACILLAG